MRGPLASRRAPPTQPRTVGPECRAPPTSSALAGTAWPSAGGAAGSVRGAGADGVGLLRASSCFFSQ